MTYPSTPLTAIGSGEAFQIGGGDYKFGQNYTEGIIRGMFTPTMPNPTNALQLLRDALLKLPLEALQAFKDLLPDMIEGAWDTVTSATDAIMGALTNVAEFLHIGDWDDWLATSWNNINQVINQIIDILTGLIVTPINAAVQGVKDWVGGLFGDTQTALSTASSASTTANTAVTTANTAATNLNGLVDDLLNIPGDVIGMLPDVNIPGLGDLTTGIWNSITGQTADASNPVTTAASTAQLAELAATTAANAAAINQLQSDADASNNNGMSGGDDFERVSSTDLGTGWLQTYSAGALGKMATPNGHDASWIDNGNGDEGCAAIRTDPADKVTLTDYQAIRLTIGSPTAEAGAGWPYNYGYGSNTIIGRANADGTIYVGAVISGSSAALFNNNGSTETALGSSVSTTQAPGVTFILECGTTGTINRYRLLRNGAVILNYLDSGGITQIGPNYRGWGFGMSAQHRGSSQSSPGAVSKITVSDNFPSTVSGTTFRAYRGSTSAVTKTGNDNVLPANCMDTVEYISGDLSWDATNQKITVQKAGTYIIGMRIRCDNVIAINETWTPLLYRQGALHSRGSGDTGMDVNGGNTSYANPVHYLRFSGGAPMMCYLNAGEYVQFGMASAGNQGIVGDAGGTETWVTMAKVG